MLVLTRQSKESIMIGQDIEVHIVEVEGGKVRVGISAPKSVKVYRREVFDQIQAGVEKPAKK